jgi:hypothetical protein
MGRKYALVNPQWHVCCEVEGQTVTEYVQD